MVYLEDCTVDSTGLPTAMTSGSACVKRMQDQTLGPGCTAITTSGGMFTLSVTTGSSAAFYIRGDYSVYLGAGTVSGVIIIGYPIAQFSIGRTTNFTLSTDVLKWNGTAVATPATAGVPDVNVKNWGNTAAAAATVSANVVQVAAATVNTSSAQLGVNVVNWGGTAAAAATVSANVTQVAAATVNTSSAQLGVNVVNIGGTAFAASVLSTNVVQIAAATVNTSSAQLGVNVVNWAGTAAAAATVSANVTTVTGTASVANAVWNEPIAGHLGAGTTGLALNSASSAGDPWATALPGAYGAGTAGSLVGNAINSTTFTTSANVTSINAVSTSAVTTVKAVQGLTTADTVTTAVNLTTNNDKTGYALTAAYDPAKTASQAGDAMTLTAAYDFAKGTAAMTESYAADTAAMTPVQALHMLWANAAQFAISSTSISVKKLDGTTEAMNFDLDSSTIPTLRNRNV